MKPTGSEHTRIVLVEGYALYAKAIALVIARNEQMEVVAELPRIDSPVLGVANPNLILIDLDTHAVDLGESLRLCRKHAPKAAVCVMTQFLKAEVMQRALSLGVDGFLAKDMSPEDFLRALASIAQGNTYVDARVAGGLIRRRAESPETAKTNEELSNRELDIIRLIADGLSNKEISARLFLSEKTIKNYTSRIFLKFGVTARTQVAVYALKAGIV